MGKHDKNKKKKHGTWSDDYSSDDLGSLDKSYNRAQAKKNWHAELEDALDEDTNGFGESQK